MKSYTNPKDYQSDRVYDGIRTMNPEQTEQHRKKRQHAVERIYTQLVENHVERESMCYNNGVRDAAKYLLGLAQSHDGMVALALEGAAQGVLSIRREIHEKEPYRHDDPIQLELPLE